ncbi:MAG: NADP-dependent malic enzyme [Spirochaetaceae bacterium]|jgi:malate dehydrogenase (oxaloacetate-decarboxylating)|nr:NADP-dependent malic enzyme [Spirochaetaceae bacterium]
MAAISLDNIDALFPAGLSEEQKARAKTAFLKRLSLEAHRFYGGKLQTAPRCGIFSPPDFNVWYTPGVSAVSTAIREDPALSFDITGRGNLVAVVSDSTRVLGDGDCGASGGIGVMEGKALLMKYLGGIDAVPLCIDSRDADGKPQARKIIEFVKMVSPSFGAVNLEDISAPNCYEALDALREECPIPVWHDDAQGTACVTLAALLSALKLAQKSLAEAKIVLLGAGAANTTIARLIIADGGNPANLILFDSQGALHSGRTDIQADTREYRKWELCLRTNPRRVMDEAAALAGADVLIALSKPGPDTVKRAWVRGMAERAIVFCCANPVPEIWPYAAREEGAFIVATGRGDFPNQVNNSVCFPGILKGALAVRARKITDGMAVRCAHAIADFSARRGVTPDNIIATMEETEVFAIEAAAVAQAAMDEGIALRPLPADEVYRRAMADIASARAMFDSLQNSGCIKPLPEEIVQRALRESIKL